MNICAKMVSASRWPEHRLTGQVAHEQEEMVQRCEEPKEKSALWMVPPSAWGGVRVVRDSEKHPFAPQTRLVCGSTRLPC